MLYCFVLKVGSAVSTPMNALKLLCDNFRRLQCVLIGKKAFSACMINQSHQALTLLAPKVLVPTPSTKEGGERMGGGGGFEMDHLKYLKNEKCYKPETLEGVRSILQGLQKFQVDIKARSHDPISGSEIGSRRPYGPISRFRFCGENVERSIVVCSHDPIFRTNIESSI